MREAVYNPNIRRVDELKDLRRLIIYSMQFELENENIGRYIHFTTSGLGDDDYNYLKRCEYNLDTTLYIKPGYKIYELNSDSSRYDDLSSPLYEEGYQVIYKKALTVT